MIYLSCVQEGVEIRLLDGSTVIVTTFNDFIKVLVEQNHNRVLCASSMDHPEDYTNDPKIIDLCVEIRS